MMTSSHHSLQGELRINESLAKHTSWRVGGIAQRFYRPANIEDLSTFFSTKSRD